MERPDLTGLPAAVSAYIEALEAKIRQLREREMEDEGTEVASAPAEPPTSINLITISAGGLAKRTPRHLYTRQRRGGMGVFDLDAPEGDAPAFLVMAGAESGLIVLTNQGRVFRVPVRDVAEREVRAKGEPLLGRASLRPDERVATIAPDTPLTGGSFLIMVTERGQVRRVAKQYLGANLQPGTVLYDVREGGAPAAVTWSTGNDDLFIVTRQGQAIRFAERLVPVRGCLGLRVEPSDQVVGVAATRPEGGVFLLGEDGKGTIRLMQGFGANKAPGAGGKIAMKADAIVGALAVDDRHDIFVISRLGKLIRFQAPEVPPKEGVVQGVNCMNLRADVCVALAGAAIPATS